jgi:hypothetical protein
MLSRTGEPHKHRRARPFALDGPWISPSSSSFPLPEAGFLQTRRPSLYYTPPEASPDVVQAPSRRTHPSRDAVTLRPAVVDTPRVPPLTGRRAPPPPTMLASGATLPPTVLGSGAALPPRRWRLSSLPNPLLREIFFWETYVAWDWNREGEGEGKLWGWRVRPTCHWIVLQLIRGAGSQTPTLKSSDSTQSWLHLEFWSGATATRVGAIPNRFLVQQQTIGWTRS